MQTVYVQQGKTTRHLCFPSPEIEVLPGIQWGRVGVFGSPAFWATLTVTSPSVLHGITNCGGTLEDEVVFCLLGGHGVTAEIATTAYLHLKEAAILERDLKSIQTEIYELLKAPLMINGKPTRYRFPRQRAIRISQAITILRNRKFDETDHERFRDMLVNIPGIGLKTASWITRNWLGSDSVAILDIHIIRAAQQIGLFPSAIRLPRDYKALEQTFLCFARCLGVRPSVLDAVMWTEMRRMRELRVLSPKPMEELWQAEVVQVDRHPVALV